MTGYIARDKLTDTLRSHRNTPEIKVLTGVRRCGKSTLLEHYAQSLLDDGVPASNIFTRRFDSFDTPIGYSATDLHADLMQATQEARPGPFYVFLDEIQDVPGWEEVVRRLHSRDDTDVYITGSNARLLSGELATHLTGRYITIPVYPLSFDEYQRHHRAQGTTDSTDQLFSKYMMFGGMPGLFVTGQPDQDRATEILTSIYESIVMKDVAGRYGIRDIATLEKLSRYLFSTSGNLFSVNKVANTLTSAGTNASYATVDNQISALERSFIVYSAQQERMRGKELLRPQRKFYPVDNGFRNLATGFNGSDRGAQLEGIVFMELQRRGYDVAIGSLPDGEIDFIAKRGNDKQYIQVTLNMTEEQTRERELAPLRRLGDAFPRTVLTLDWHSEGMTDEGIHITNVMDWLCS
ncbi:ATP-binding protein [Bifidobacterium breve]|uniref:ATP-binding protein n=1 Tax=Bifidobacterium breve TaxID=1685 RepID=UPI0022AE6DB4|nr:ATP-binding protein [Bifidobacterium breve]MCZ4465841.1 ATP-binding protein [Bifidobacterium breve]MCZ4467327.1 ATP-binding protein [Bifidobacterium breve]MCZ4471068.1 ATP-binding protein [Bifidobacterium breve]